MDKHIEPSDLERARADFEKIEPRALFYRVAIELVDLALQGKTPLKVAEGLAVLLQTWNKAYCRYHKFDEAHFASLEALVSKHQAALRAYRERTIEALGQGDDEKAIPALFEEFENLLGPVGAAKALHLLAPRLFPLWDGAIAKAYGFGLRRRGTNRKRYWCFAHEARRQVLELKRARPVLPDNPLKLIDEYNYCTFTNTKKKGPS